MPDRHGRALCVSGLRSLCHAVEHMTASLASLTALLGAQAERSSAVPGDQA